MENTKIMFETDTIMRVIYGLMLLVLILGWNFSSIKKTLSQSVQYIIVWAIIFGGIIFLVTTIDLL